MQEFIISATASIWLEYLDIEISITTMKPLLEIGIRYIESFCRKGRRQKNCDDVFLLSQAKL